MSKRTPLLPAILYFAWGSFVFFFAGPWWPIFVYPIIWPLSLGIDALMHHIYPLVEVAARSDNSVWIHTDWLAGFLYVALGAAWVWLLTHIIWRATAQTRA